ncbi:DUF221-domain-containing protein [Phellopilus nigrolimitatus]|nr:DUF221-domain-containing protein [Phellopilus nigrolimitatus]
MSSADSAKTASTKTFETSLWINAAVFGVELLAFTLLRRRFKAIYEPRTYIPPESKRSPPLAKQLLGWPLAVWRADYRNIIAQNGMDAYFFVRFLRMMVIILLPIWLVSWAVLMPVTSVNTDSGKSGLDKFTFGNIGKDDQPRYAAHIVLTWVFTAWIWYNIRKEMANFVMQRQQFLIDPAYASTAQANTILVTGVPRKFLSESALAKIYSHLPGGVKKVWLNRDLKDLPALYDRRLAACSKLESAETSLLKAATAAHAKQAKAGAAGDAKAGPNDPERGTAAALVPEKDRPTHRLPIGPLPFALPLVGKKVDSIMWARDEITETNNGLREGRAVLRRETDLGERGARSPGRGKLHGVAGLVTRGGKRSGSFSSKPDEQRSSPNTDGDTELATETYPPLNSAFVLFHNQAAAHMAAQVLTHHAPYCMSEKHINVAPGDVIWGNLGLNPYEKKVRLLVSYAATAGLIILWAFPVAFVGAVSNVATLCTTYSWLAWICTLPPIVIGIIQGILPPVLLSVLMMLLPIVLRLLAKFEGIPRRTGVELSLMTRYFIFQIIHSFLIVTLASGIIAALPGLVSDPTEIPSLLASNLPQASNFFLTYVVLQGLSGAAAGFLQIVPLIIYYVKLFLMGSTPRSVYSIKYTLRNVSWGTLFPATTLITVITITYSVISPIINGLAFFTFLLFYLLYKYLFLYQFDQPAAGDTGGLFFPKAIQHVFVGMYIQQICLAALFFLARDENSKAGALPEGILMIILIVATAIFHMVINNSYDPILQYLPLSLADKAHGIALRTEDAPAAGRSSGASASPRTRADSAHSSYSQRKPVASSSAKVSLEGEGDVDLEKSERTGLVDTAEDANGEGPEDFYHPASVESLRPVWIPQDALGLARTEEEDNAVRGIEASSAHAFMDEKGHVDVDGHPPGTDELKL